MRTPGYIHIREQRTEGNGLSMDIEINRWDLRFWFDLLSRIRREPLWAMPFVYLAVIWAVATKWDNVLRIAASHLAKDQDVQEYFRQTMLSQ